MVKITKTGEQYRITLPKEVLQLKKWNENTELIFIPMMKEASEKLTEKTPILIREAGGENCFSSFYV